MTRILMLLAALAITLPFAAAAAPASAAPDPTQEFREIRLETFVPAARTPQRIILQPYGVQFDAELAAPPRPQKAEYLQQALQLMHVSEPPRVSQAVLLRYGRGETLVAYIDDGAAARLARELRPGQTRRFYAFHVYNFARGPALVVTSFGAAAPER
ncbi:hypothetical protein [Rubrivivax gelatinosus]|uniref:Uncharacterized protein n=1 Tax=Rubrivivax gelatinosus TaxID=28068 RepID=A0A4V2SGL8_RUBGE|nr:hypothetical protein [Rubrivivax gelatinosus]MBK1689720.1 hypothetical protein [Rubrivivax gelatinosus]TCP01518.1 hypothetical protein EV684_109157 [Rubrivivax gelatinosus]